MSRTIEIRTTVEVELSEIDTDTLLEELKSRDMQLGGLMPELSRDFLLGDQNAVIEKIKTMVRENGYPV